jgi:threonine synthase
MVVTLMHGVRIAGRQLRPLEPVREPPYARDRARQPVNEFRIEGQKTAGLEILSARGDRDALCIPVGNAGNITSYSAVNRDGCAAAPGRRPRAPRRSSRVA